MKIDYKALGVQDDEIPYMQGMAYLALGQSLTFLMTRNKTINKENILKTLIYEIEKKHNDTHRAYRLAIEIVAIHGR